MYLRLSKYDVLFIHACNKNAIKLPPQKEKEYVSLYKETGNKQYFEILLRANMYIIIDSVLKNLIRAEDFGDMVNEGILSFHHAIMNYDPDKNTKLSAYAFYKIQARLKEYVFEKSNHVTMKRNIKNIISKFKKNIQKLNRNGLYTIEEILKLTGININQYKYNPVLFNNIISEYFNDKEHYDSIAYIYSYYLGNGLCAEPKPLNENQNIDKILKLLKTKNIPRDVLFKVKKIITQKNPNTELTEEEKQLILKHVSHELKLWR